eukprot:366268-Chlamydomonas_euryale.AAC.4
MGCEDGLPEHRQQRLQECAQRRILALRGDLVDGHARVNGRALGQRLDLHWEITIVFPNKLGKQVARERKLGVGGRHV